MKSPLIPSLLVGIALLAACTTPTPAAKAPDNVTVQFQDPDKFTDVRENNSTITSTYYLGVLKDYLARTASPLLGAGQKLTVTFTDIDLAGENLFNQPNMVRVVKDIYSPKAKLKFQLLAADGSVIKEGERQLIDLNFMMQSTRIGSNEPLYYDKQMLKQWVQTEFAPKS